jgi:hypothetical protein
LVYAEDPLRSFQAAVRLYDMNVMSVYHCDAPYSSMIEILTTPEDDEETGSEETKATETREAEQAISEGSETPSEEAIEDTQPEEVEKGSPIN